MAKKTKSLIAVEQIDGMIRTIRGVRVMLDRDLAKIYGVPTFRFNEAINAIDIGSRPISCFSLPLRNSTHSRRSLQTHRKLRYQNAAAAGVGRVFTPLPSTAHFKLQMFFAAHALFR